MLPSEFNALPLNTRADIIWEKGKFSETVYESEVSKIVIYTFDGFFVEVIYNVADHKMVEVIAWEKKIDKDEILKKVERN